MSLPPPPLRRVLHGYDRRPASELLCSTGAAGNTNTRARQHEAHASGVALRSHAESAHAGAIDERCPACRELRSKLEKEAK